MTTTALPSYPLSTVLFPGLMLAMLGSERPFRGWVDGDITTPTYAFIRVIDWGHL